MGLQLTQNHKGVSANYWKIISSTNNFLTGETHTTLGLYQTKTKRDLSEDNHIALEKHTVQGVDLTRAKIYPKLLVDIDTGEVDEEGAPILVESKFKSATAVLE